MRVLLAAVVCLSLVASAWGHAHLTSPLAWNPSPSKTAPCGAGSAFLDVASPQQGTLKTGQAWQFQWQLVALDGSGPVTVKFDPAYGTNFQQAQVASIISGPDSSIDVLGTYTLQVTVPSDLVCTGGPAGNLCSVQFESSSAWYSCTTITTDKSVIQYNVTNNQVPLCVSPTAAQSQMFFCQNNQLGNYALRGATQFGVWTGAGAGNNNVQPLLQQPNGFILLDQIANATFVQNMRSPLVFTNSKTTNGLLSTACADAYTRYLCAQMFPACNPQQVGWLQPCKSTCYAAVEICGLQSSHQNLIDCVDNPNYAHTNYRAYDSVNQNCPPCTGDCLLTVQASASHTAASLVALLVSIVMACMLM